MLQFKSVSLDDILKKIKNFKSAKNCTFKNMPVRCLKEAADISNPLLTQTWSSKIINKKSFLTNLKLADVNPAFKKIDSTLAKNYRPVIVLPTTSKVLKELMRKQLNNYITKFLSPFSCGYRKEYSTQFALMTLIKKWKVCVDQKRYAGPVLMDLSKVFDSIHYPRATDC